MPEINDMPNGVLKARDTTEYLEQGIRRPGQGDYKVLDGKKDPDELESLEAKRLRSQQDEKLVN